MPLSSNFLRSLLVKKIVKSGQYLARPNVRKDFFYKQSCQILELPTGRFRFSISSINYFKRNLNKIDFTDFIIIQ